MSGGSSWLLQRPGKDPCSSMVAVLLCAFGPTKGMVLVPPPCCFEFQLQHIAVVKLLWCHLLLLALSTVTCAADCQLLEPQDSFLDITLRWGIFKYHHEHYGMTNLVASVASRILHDGILHIRLTVVRLQNF
jgi:hypothetical protein